jgi:hypothetical protein
VQRSEDSEGRQAVLINRGLSLEFIFYLIPICFSASENECRASRKNIGKTKKDACSHEQASKGREGKMKYFALSTIIQQLCQLSKKNNCPK